MTTNKQRREPYLRELEHWPGVEHRLEMGGSHARLVLTHGGKSRFVTMSVSPGDRRAALNNISVMRRILRGLGATRAP